LAAKFFTPFQVLSKVGTVAYKLLLPATSKIHPIFHISQLRKQVGPKPVQSTLPEIGEQALIAVKPIAILNRRLGKKDHGVVVYVLIQWSNTSKEEATWELYTDIKKCSPNFNLDA